MKSRCLRACPAAAVALFAALSTTPAVAAEPPTSVRVVTPFATGHILADTSNKLKELLEATCTGNREEANECDADDDVTFNVTVGTSVLNEQTIDPAMTSCDPASRAGEIMITGGQPLQDWAPQYNFINGPYVLRDFPHLQSVWASHLGDEARELIAANGNLLSLAIVYRGFRQFTSNKVIVGPADFQGLKLRLPAITDWVTVWSSLGAVPVLVPLPGIHDALKNGTAEASEGDLTQFQSLRLFDVQSRLTLTSHLVGFGMVEVNRCFLEGLSRHARKKLRRAVRHAAEFGTAQMFAREGSLLTLLQSEGMTVATPDAAAIRAAARPSIVGLFATKWTVTTWDEVLAF